MGHFTANMTRNQDFALPVIFGMQYSIGRLRYEGEIHEHMNHIGREGDKKLNSSLYQF